MLPVLMALTVQLVRKAIPVLLVPTELMALTAQLERKASKVTRESRATRGSRAIPV